MRSPSVQRLMSTFNLTTNQTLLIKRLAGATDSFPIASDEDRKRTLAYIIETECPETHDYVRRMYGDPYRSHMWRVTVALHAIDGILGTHGIEPYGEGTDPRNGYAPPVEYLNAGDAYAATLIYTRATDTLSIGCWEDLAEREESR